MLNIGVIALTETRLDRIDLALERIIGAKPAHMRPPYGSYNDAVLQVVKAHKQGGTVSKFASFRDSFLTKVDSYLVGL